MLTRVDMSTQEPFAGIIGHAAACEFLRRALSWQTLGQALCFVGPSQVGKCAVATRLAQALLSVKNLDTHPDYVVVRREPDPKTEQLRKEISVDQIRELRSRLQLGSFLNSWKVAVIEDAETLSLGAANALLKTLEEPASKTLIILVATGIDSIPATIASRCQVVRFRLVPDAVLARGLESRGIARRDADAFALSAAGRPGLAVRLAEDADYRTAWEERRQEAGALTTGKLHERLLAAANILGEKATQNEQALRARAVLDDAAALLRRDLSTALAERDDVTSARLIVRGLATASTLKIMLHQNANPRLCLEQFVLSLA